MISTRSVWLCMLAMIAFAGNSILCRLALVETDIDAASFTTIRLLSGAVVLAGLLRLNAPGREQSGDWIAATFLFIYAAGFSYAYIGLSAANGALILFAAVQVTMISTGIVKGERLSPWQLTGFLLALAGLLILLLPGASKPAFAPAMLMMLAGMAWGGYSILGARASDPLATTAGNFLRTVPMAIVLSLLMLGQFQFDLEGVMLAIGSGALASGVGYAIWYSVLPELTRTQAASTQLSVPVIASLAAVVILAEPLTLRLVVASVVILGGIAMVIKLK